MCARTTCRSCGRPTVSGCGQHVEQALRGIPNSERCQGHATARTTAVPQAAARQKGGGFLSRLFGGE